MSSKEDDLASLLIEPDGTPIYDAIRFRLRAEETKRIRAEDAARLAVFQGREGTPSLDTKIEGWVSLKKPCNECGASIGGFHVSGCNVARDQNLRTIGGTFKRGTMNSNNGVIRVGRKGKKKFAFGDDGAPFEVDVVVAFQEWINIDDGFRERGNTEDRSIPVADMRQYHQAAVEFVKDLAVDSDTKFTTPNERPNITTAEALDFIARLRECYDEVVDFFQPKPRGKQDLPATSAAELRFSAEPTN